MEYRKYTRKRSFLGAKIVLEGGCSVFDCIVKDISASGARLRVQNSMFLPDNFRLMISDGRDFQAAVQWRHIDSLGVHFVDTAGK